MAGEASADPLEQMRMAFLKALNDGGGADEAATLLGAGADIDAWIVPIVEQTLVHYAAAYRNSELIALLARRGANLDACNAFGMTPMHLAVMHEIDAMLLQEARPGFACARLLKDFGADVDVIDNHGRAPRDLAGVYGPQMLDLFDEVMT